MQKKHSPQVIYVPITWEGSDQPEVPEMPPVAEVGLNAASAAVMSGIQGMMKAFGESLEDFQNGKINEKQFTYRVIHKGTKEATKGGVRTAAALSVSEATKQWIAKKWGQEVVKRFTRHNFLVAMAYGVVDQTMDTIKLQQGKLSTRDYKVKSITNLGSTGGAIGGAAAGAMIGSVLPGLGTGTGALVGYMFSMMGSAGGASLGKNLGEEWFPEESPQESGTTDSSSEKK